MNADGLKTFLKVRPFQAFTIHEAGGESHRVVSPESIHIADKLGLVILYPPDGSLVRVDTGQITSAEYPAPAPDKGAKKPK